MATRVLFDPIRTRQLIESFLGRLEELVCTRAEGGPWALIGIHRRGDLLAQRLAQRVAVSRGLHLPMGVLDITLYRDDYSPDRPQPQIRPTQVPFQLDGASVLLVDDVFQTGRTIRAALTQLADFGRPARIVLAVLMDRKMRELPICPDVVGVELDLPRGDTVQLRLAEIDGADQVVVVTSDSGSPTHATPSR
ncbi:MAG: bifunctional pyr operon transcriptional regulator/uracil phosphoribosyltransferase PyrR [Planctomycetota bacterium]